MGNIEKIENLQAFNERLTTQIKNLKLAGQKAGARVTTAVCATGGGAVAGFLDGTKLARLPNTNVSTAGVIGAGLVAAAACDLFDNYSEHVGAMGAGMLSYEAGKACKSFAQQRMAA